MPTPSTDARAASRDEISAISSQLATIILLIETHHRATDQRIDDLRQAIQGRLDGHEKRLGQVELNERNTAIRTAGIAATSGALVAAAFELIRRTVGH